MFELLLSSGMKRGSMATWTKMKTEGIPTGINSAATATWKTDIYFAGGLVSGAPSASLYKYSVTANQFIKLKDMPAPLSGAKAIMGDGKLYVWGGYNGTIYTSIFYIYTIATDTWTVGSIPGVANTRPGSVNAIMTNIGLDIYILGGDHGDATENGTSKFVKYNPLTNTWTALADFPNAISGGCAKVYNELIYVAYGNYNSGADNQAAIVSYDPVANTWTTVVNDIVTIDGPKLNPCSAMVGTKIHYWGGNPDSEDVIIFDPFDKSVVKGGTVPEELRGYGNSGFMARGKFYSLGPTPGAEFWTYDGYFGKAMPGLSVVPFQEFGTSAEITALLVGRSNFGTDLYPAFNWYLIRLTNGNWIVPQKPLRRATRYGDIASVNSEISKTIAGASWRISNPTDGTLNTINNWAILFSRIEGTTLPVQPTLGPKLANFSPQNDGFVPYSYAWSGIEVDANTQRTMGGSSWGGVGAANKNPQGTDTADLRPLFKYVSGEIGW